MPSLLRTTRKHAIAPLRLPSRVTAPGSYINIFDLKPSVAMSWSSTSKEACVQRHDQWYTDIVHNVFTAATPHRGSGGPAEAEEKAFTPCFLYFLKGYRTMEDRGKLVRTMLECYSEDAKVQRGSYSWDTSTFKSITPHPQSDYGTFLVETSAGYKFTGCAVPFCGQPAFDAKTDLGFRRLATPGIYEHVPTGASIKVDALNAWFYRECSQPGVEYSLFPLSTATKALGKIPGNAFVDFLRLMHVVDTIYHGTIWGVNDRDAAIPDPVRAEAIRLAHGLRPRDMPVLDGKGANRSLACAYEGGESNDHCDRAVYEAMDREWGDLSRTISWDKEAAKEDRVPGTTNQQAVL